MIDKIERTLFEVTIEADLLPCAHCGCEPEVKREWYDFHSQMWVVCPNCGIHTKRFFVTKNGRKEMTEVWNSRVVSPSNIMKKIRFYIFVPFLAVSIFACDIFNTLSEIFKNLIKGR